MRAEPQQPETLEAYIATLYLLDVQIGLVRGYDFYVDRNWREDWFVVVQLEANYESSYQAWEESVTYNWAAVNTSVDIQEGDNGDVSENLSEQEIASQASYAENESFEMSEAEKDEVAAEDRDQEIASADADVSMEETSDDDAEDMSADNADDAASDDDGGD